jgi:hypothetical protein
MLHGGQGLDAIARPGIRRALTARSCGLLSTRDRAVPRAPRRSRTLLIALASVLLPLLTASAASATEVTRTFTAQEEAFLVPQGVTSIKVTAIGGRGGENVQNQAGGRGAKVSGTLTVTPGQILYVHVGGNGAKGTSAGAAGEGGHTSDTRTAPLSAGLSPDPRLIVAGAGGGAGGVNVAPAFTGESKGGNAEESAGETPNAMGGEGAGLIAGGEGGFGTSGCADPGNSGVLELGGAGGSCFIPAAKLSYHGGGGGSSLVPAGGTQGLAEKQEPQVTVTYVQPPNPPVVVSGSATELRETAVRLNGTVNPENEEVSCTFEYGPTEAYGSSAPCTPSPSGIAPVAVSAAISGLERVTTYHWRLTATNANGTSHGADGTFTTLPQEPPTVTSVNPTEGPLGGGNSVTITGTNLNGASAVDFGTTPATSFTIESPTTITATAPEGSGTVDATVTTPGGTSPTAAGDRYTYVAAPTAGTNHARELTETSAGLHSKVASTAPFTDCHFEYGTTEAYGSSASCSLPAPGTSFPEVTVSGLTRATTYHFRISVSNAGGTTNGGDQTFMTLGPPEYGRCIKFDGFGGEYTTASCTIRGTFSYAWFAAFDPANPIQVHFTTAIKAPTVAKIQTVAGKLITCKGETSNGEYTGDRTIGNITIKFTGCSLETGSCTSSGAAEGEVVTSVLQGTLGVIKKGTEAAKNTVGTDLGPASGEVIASFACAGTPVTVTGASIGELKRDVMNATPAIKFTETKGVQKPVRFEGGPEEVLHVKIGEGAAQQAGLFLTTTQTNQEKVEVNTVF